MELIMYTTGCPKCKVLASKLNAKGVEYETCTDTSVMESKGIETLPVLSVDGKLLEFSDAVKWVNNA
jgi:glutaredoxin